MKTACKYLSLKMFLLWKEGYASFFIVLCLESAFNLYVSGSCIFFFTEMRLHNVLIYTNMKKIFIVLKIFADRVENSPGGEIELIL